MRPWWLSGSSSSQACTVAAPKTLKLDPRSKQGLVVISFHVPFDGMPWDHRTGPDESGRSRLVLVPASDRTIGHRTLALAAAWKPYLEELLRAAPC